MTSVAMTDHGNMFGAIDFYNAMRAEDIKPIIGMEAIFIIAMILEIKQIGKDFTYVYMLK